MTLGIVGLGRMGGGIAARLRRHGHEVVGLDHDLQRSDATSVADLVARLEPPRVVWVMVPAGDPTEAVVAELAGLLGPGDLVVDGGNAHYVDSVRRHRELADRSVGFVDAGVSGGVWGLDEGFCLMVGGEPGPVARLAPVLSALAPPGGVAHVGPPGAGHFTKMVHNAVEYGMMQSLAEGYELLGASDLDLDVAATVRVWRHGSVIRSWLLDLLDRAISDRGASLDGIAGHAEDSGEGRWAVEEAVRLAVPAPMISAALFARFASRQDDSPAMRAIAALRNQFGGHAITAPGE